MPPAKSNGSAASLDTWNAQPFITEEQRSALDAALADKMRASGNLDEMEKKLSRKNSAHAEPLKTKGELLKDHHTRSGKGTGKAKKGGAGGKFTWGNPLTPPDGLDTPDKADPNYDSAEEDVPVSYHEEVAVNIKLYKQAVAEIIQEYFNSGDLNEAANTLEELEEPEFNHFFVKRLITMALDKHDREREMASVLLSSLYAEAISPDQMRKGFQAVVSAADDLRLDVPFACDLIAMFIARAVVDDVLPPSFVATIPAVEGSAAAELRTKCELHLSARHSAERLLRCWGSGAGLMFKETRDSIAKMLQEYRDSHDMDEAERCLTALAVPFFHHEAVKQALLLGMESPECQPTLLGLLARLTRDGTVSASQATKGFQRVAERLEDVELDCPGGREQFQRMLSAATEQGWLDASFDVPAGTPAPEACSAHSVATYKRAAIAAIREYFDSADAGEVAARLAELQQPGLANIFVKQACQLSMERKEREREMVSCLLPALGSDVMPPDQVALAFTRLLASCEDLALDVPDAPQMVTLFLGRAVVDEVLPPAFLTAVIPSLRSNSLGISVLHQTGKMLAARHAAERLQQCWHGGGRTIEQLRDSMDALLKEFADSGDATEAARCLMELDVAHYHHELVKRALVHAFDEEAMGKPASAPRLLASLSASGAINQTQMRQGFDRVEAGLEDLQLDYPNAPGQFAAYKAKAVAEGWLGEAQ